MGGDCGGGDCSVFDSDERRGDGFGGRRAGQVNPRRPNEPPAWRDGARLPRPRVGHPRAPTNSRWRRPRGAAPSPTWRQGRRSRSFLGHTRVTFVLSKHQFNVAGPKRASPARGVERDWFPCATGPTPRAPPQRQRNAKTGTTRVSLDWIPEPSSHKRRSPPVRPSPGPPHSPNIRLAPTLQPPASGALATCVGAAGPRDLPRAHALARAGRRPQGSTSVVIGFYCTIAGHHPTSGCWRHYHMLCSRPLCHPCLFRPGKVGANSDR